MLPDYNHLLFMLTLFFCMSVVVVLEIEGVMDQIAGDIWVAGLYIFYFWYKRRYLDDDSN